MQASLIPLFDDKLKVRAYSVFAHKKNMLLNPSLLGTGSRDGAGTIDGIEVINSVGFDTLSEDENIFISVDNIALFSDIEGEVKDAPKDRIVLLITKAVKPEEMYVNRIKALKDQGFKLAVRKLEINDFEPYKPIISLADYIFLDNKKIDIRLAKVYFGKVYPNVKLIAGNVETAQIYEKLVADGGYSLYEGAFYRVPVTVGQKEVSPLKINYIELLNIVNDIDFDLTKAADIIGRDTALVLKLLQIVNRMSINSEITSIRHAAAMLGQRELKKWINTVVTNQLCADKPNEITRVSLLRAKFAENLAPLFELKGQAQELFLMGLFSVIDIILDMPMEEALKKVKIPRQIEKALINKEGDFYDVLDFILAYESADWGEIDRLSLIKNIDDSAVYDAYKNSLEWYRDLFSES